MFNERTPNKDLPLPHINNPLNVDVERLREAWGIVDAYLAQNDIALAGIAEEFGAPGGLATLGDDGIVPSSQLPPNDEIVKMSALWSDMTGIIVDYALSSPPSASWLMCFGQPLLATDIPAAALRAKLIADFSPYGADGDGNPLLPDYRGRGSAGRDDMGGTAAGRLTVAGAAIDGKKLGAAGGSETHILTTPQLASHLHGVTDPGHTHTVSDPGHTHAVTDPTHAHSIYDPGHAHLSLGSKGQSDGASYVSVDGISNDINSQTTASGTGIGIYAAYTGISIVARATGVTVAAKVAGISTVAAGGGLAHNNTQPTIVLNKIIHL